MELLQDLQKHFQSLVFNINLQYGNMISMNEFLENCQKHSLMMQDLVDLFEKISERYLKLEEENRKYRDVIVAMKLKYSGELIRIKEDLHNLRKDSQEQGNLHHEEALQIFHAWTYAVNAFENTSKSIVNNMWKSNQELTAKLKLSEKENNQLKVELNNSSRLSAQDHLIEELETQLKSLKKEKDAVVDENKLLAVSINSTNEQLQTELQRNSELVHHTECLCGKIDELQKENLLLKEDNSSLRIRNTTISKMFEEQFRIISERVHVLSLSNTESETTIQHELESLRMMSHQFQSSFLQELVTQRARINKLERLTRKLKQENHALEQSVKDTLSSYKRLLRMGNLHDQYFVLK
ncbi:hypothetical protein C9374_007017 [Naegleria lovaniensis]|uniref:Uncharacterized protein n=1 Tax=Naegleria lovaniensis TaxID=51637 RepID=A0AA88KRQ1_NAELO|nr:uncharacterized protein C9374_007017 [Naegleria lovaniensis]KAG2393486.1 hypothetical protein C9374_007017 [Naegleria lovaniensis]